MGLVHTKTARTAAGTSVASDGLSLYELSESKELPEMSAEERQNMLAWRDRVASLAEKDPDAYREACRSGVLL
jgi:hypothetical protein